MAKLYLISLGCNKNLVDSEVMLGRLKNYEITDDVSSADVLIVNTCGFIESAKEESIRAILELSSERKKGSLLVVTGCLMQRYADELMSELEGEVDLFAGLGDFAKIDELIAKRENADFKNAVFLQEQESRVITGSNYHAYIKISEGCNQKCAFCAIPTFKGKLQSRSLSAISAEIKELVGRGYKDFSFIAQDSSSYMKDSGERDGLLALIDAVEGIAGVRSARILYLYPSSTSLALVRKIIASPVFVNYFDMPIQHISESLLNTMRRGTPKEHILKLLETMRAAPNSFLRTGVIVGHPGESEADFNELCEFLESFSFDRISAFAYSREENTLAYDMEQVSKKIINSRLKKIEKITTKALNTSLAAMRGKEILVYLNGKSDESELFYSAKPLVWDRDIDGEVLINESEIKKLENGKLYCAKITELAGLNLIATITKEA